MELTMCLLKLGLFSLIIIGSVWSKGFEYEPGTLRWEDAERACHDQNMIMVPGRKYRFKGLQSAMKDGDYVWLYGWRSVSDITPDADDKLKSLKVDFSKPRKNPGAVACFNGSTYTTILDSARSVLEGRDVCENTGSVLVDITTEDDVIGLTNSMSADEPHWANSITSQGRSGFYIPSKIKQCLYARKEGSEVHYEYGNCSQNFNFICIGEKDEFSPFISLKIARFDEFQEAIETYIASHPQTTSSVISSSTPMVTETSTTLDIPIPSSLPVVNTTTSQHVDMVTTSSVVEDTSSSVAVPTTSSIAMSTTSSIAIDTSSSDAMETTSSVPMETSSIAVVTTSSVGMETEPIVVIEAASSIVTTATSSIAPSTVAMVESETSSVNTMEPSSSSIEIVPQLQESSSYDVTTTSSSVVETSLSSVLDNVEIPATSSKEMYATTSQSMDYIHYDASDAVQIQPSKTVTDTTSDSVSEEVTTSDIMTSSVTGRIPDLFTDLPISTNPSSILTSSYLPDYNIDSDLFAGVFIKNKTMSSSGIIPPETVTFLDTSSVVQPTMLPDVVPLPTYNIMSTSTPSVSTDDSEYTGYYNTYDTVTTKDVTKQPIPTSDMYDYSTAFNEMTEEYQSSTDVIKVTPTSTIVSSSVIMTDPIIEPYPTYNIESSMSSQYIPSSGHVTEISSTMITDEAPYDYDMMLTTSYTTIPSIDDMYTYREPTSTHQVYASTPYFTIVDTSDTPIDDDDDDGDSDTRSDSVDTDIGGDIDVHEYDEDNVSAIESHDVPKNEEGIELGVWIAFGILIALVIVSLVLAFVLYKRRKQQKAKIESPNTVSGTVGGASNTIELRDSRSPSRENGKTNGPQSV